MERTTKVSCVARIGDLPEIGTIKGGPALRGSWMVYFQVDGGIHGDPATSLIFQANIESEPLRFIDATPAQRVGLTVTWRPGPYLRGNDERNAEFQMSNLASWRPAEQYAGKDTLVQKFTSPGRVHANLLMDVGVWDQYPSVKSRIEKLLSKEGCDVGIKVKRTEFGYKNHLDILKQASKVRFCPIYRYPTGRPGFGKILDLRKTTVIRSIDQALEQHLPDAQYWIEGGRGDPAHIFQGFFQLPERLEELLEQGVVVQEGDNVGDSAVHGSASSRVAEDLAEGSEDGELLE